MRASTSTIGVLGAGGSVGRHAVATLRAAGAGSLRLAGRRREPLVALARAAGVRCEVVGLDVTDTAAVSRFAAGCVVVLDCTGVVRGDGGRARAAVLAAGAHHVDAGEPPPIAVPEVPPDARAVGAAGLAPGLSGLLPRWVARDAGPGATLRSWLAIRDELSPTAASDLLLGPVDGRREPLAAWRDGAVRAAAETRRRDVDWPLHPDAPEPVALHPSLGSEEITVAQALGLRDATWWTVLAAPATCAALELAAALPHREGVEALCRAAALDVAGRAPWAILACEVKTPDGAVRSAAVDGLGGSALTGGVAAVAALAVAAGEVAPGTHLAADVLDPSRTLETLVVAGLATVREVEGPVDDLAAVEEGAL